MPGKIIGNLLKYALIERERKFILAPDYDLVKGLPIKVITDHYIEGTYMRFRKITGNEGPVYKLTKKSPEDTPDRYKSLITSIFLTEQEYELLNKFESTIVEKTRFNKEINGINIGIDKYLKGNDELWLAEIEFENDEQMSSFEMPFDYIKEVTDVFNFNGYHLAKRFGRKSHQ